MTDIVDFPHRRCHATLRVEDEGVWCRQLLRCLRQTALYDNMVGWNRFIVTFSLRFGLFVPLGAPRIFKPQSFYLHSLAQPNLCSVLNSGQGGGCAVTHSYLPYFCTGDFSLIKHTIETCVTATVFPTQRDDHGVHRKPKCVAY